MQLGQGSTWFSPGGGQYYAPAFHVSPLLLSRHVTLHCSFTQRNEDLKVFKSVHAAVEKSLVDGVPLWHVDPANSTICIVSKSQMDHFTDEEVQEIFEAQHIVISDQFVPNMVFDGNGLRSLAELNKPVTIQGQWLLMIFYTPSC